MLHYYNKKVLFLLFLWNENAISLPHANYAKRIYKNFCDCLDRELPVSWEFYAFSRIEELNDTWKCWGVSENFKLIYAALPKAWIIASGCWILMKLRRFPVVSSFWISSALVL